MPKCILFSRVSTEHQKLDSQTQVLHDEALRNGYKEDDLILIECKESAIMLDEDERIGLTQLKNEIFNDDTINCVICYEVSRISRKPKVVFSIRDFLIDRKIQLIVIKPYMQMLKDGVMSPEANMMFGLFASLSEIEMSTKKDRMMRGRKYKMQQGYYGGGWLAFGYMKDANDKIIIDPDEAKIVRKIYNMYERGMSASTIAKELIELGELPQITQDAGQQFVTKTIQREQYVGTGKGNNYTYPQIISQEQYDRCKAIRANKSKPRTGTSVQYYGHGIVYNELGRLLTPSKANNVYTSYHIDKKHTVSINLNMLDSIIWHVAKSHVGAAYIENGINNKKDYVDRKHDEIIKKIEAIDKKIEILSKRIDHIEDMMMDGYVSVRKGAEKKISLLRDIDVLQETKDRYLYEENQLMNEIIYMNSFMYNSDNLNWIDDIKDDKDRIKLIKQTIRRIDAIKDESKIMGRYWLTFTFTDDKIERYKIRTTGLRKDLYDENGNQIIFEMLKRV